jgi:hypothetical protein
LCAHRGQNGQSSVHIPFDHGFRSEITRKRIFEGSAQQQRPFPNYLEAAGGLAFVQHRISTPIPRLALALF